MNKKDKAKQKREQILVALAAWNKLIEQIKSIKGTKK